MSSRTITIALVTIALSLAATACGGSGSNDVTTEVTVATTTTTTVPRPAHDVDELIAIRAGRLHLRCVGRGATTVLLVAGWGDGGENWGAVEPAIRPGARVCSYARFGTGTSDAPATTQTFESQAAELHELLAEAAEPGPYVVLGHSFGGAEAVTFASKYRREVTGLMLLDASPTTWPATVCSVAAYAPVCDVMHDASKDPERLDVFPAFQQVATVRSLGALPMTVMTAAHRTDSSLDPAELGRLDEVWNEGVQRWATLSTSSRIVTVQQTGHHIELDQPQQVVGELLKLLPSLG